MTKFLLDDFSHTSHDVLLLTTNSLGIEHTNELVDRFQDFFFGDRVFEEVTAHLNRYLILHQFQTGTIV